MTAGLLFDGSRFMVRYDADDLVQLLEGGPEVWHDRVVRHYLRDATRLRHPIHVVAPDGETLDIVWPLTRRTKGNRDRSARCQIAAERRERAAEAA